MTDEQTADTPTDDVEQQSDSDLGEAGEKALKAERARANKLERDYKALQQAFDANVASSTGTKQALDQFKAEAAAQLAARDLTLTKYKVGVSKGLPEALINRLQGDDENSIAADADELMRFMPAPSPTNHTPRPDPSQGAKKPAPSSAQDVFSAFMADKFTN